MLPILIFSKMPTLHQIWAHYPLMPFVSSLSPFSSALYRYCSPSPSYCFPCVCPASLLLIHLHPITLSAVWEESCLCARPSVEDFYIVGIKKTQNKLNWNIWLKWEQYRALKVGRLFPSDCMRKRFYFIFPKELLFLFLYNLVCNFNYSFTPALILGWHWCTFPLLGVIDYHCRQAVAYLMVCNYWQIIFEILSFSEPFYNCWW